MAKEKIPFEDFLMDVNPNDLEFVMQMHEFMTEKGCTVEIKTAKSGFVVSYSDGTTKKVVANYVFRKKGLIMRIYGDHISHYADIMDTITDDMAKGIEKAPACKRLLDPAKCNSRCPMGYIFTLNGTEHKKCRYNSFMFLINEENNPYIRSFVEHEIKARTA